MGYFLLLSKKVYLKALIAIQNIKIYTNAKIISRHFIYCVFKCDVGEVTTLVFREIWVNQK